MSTLLFQISEVKVPTPKVQSALPPLELVEEAVPLALEEALPNVPEKQSPLS